MSNLVADEEIHATCVAAIMAALIHVENVEDISHHDLKADSQVGWPNNFLNVLELFSP